MHQHKERQLKITWDLKYIFPLPKGRNHKRKGSNKQDMYLSEVRN